MAEKEQDSGIGKIESLYLGYAVFRRLQERRGIQCWREGGQEAAGQWLDSWTAWVDALCAGQ